MKFAKWEGLGNDFVLVTDEPSVEQVRRLCDRRRGVGADGVLWLVDDSNSLPQMVVLNADGSRPEMCGNGLRCAVGYFAQQRRSSSGQIDILTDSGVLGCHYQHSSDGYLVRCDMGGTELVRSMTFGGFSFQHIRVGNPHLVTFDAFTQEDFDSLGPALQREVDGGVNVEFCRLGDASIDVLVWERGVGPTQACGTGACAVAAAAVAQGHADQGEAVLVNLPGGGLTITIDSNSHATMEGPARHVFSGVFHQS